MMLASTGLALHVQAGEGCCAHCGCRTSQKVCRLVCEEKKVTVTCWGCLEEPFCVAGPSEPKCQHVETVCRECAKPGEPVTGPKRFVWTEWCPLGCPEMYTRRKLMKRTETKTIPSYKWVVEDLCPSCQQACGDIPQGEKLPPVPQVAAGLPQVGTR